MKTASGWVSSADAWCRADDGGRKSWAGDRGYLLGIGVGKLNGELSLHNDRGEDGLVN